MNNYVSPTRNPHVNPQSFAQYLKESAPDRAKAVVEQRMVIQSAMVIDTDVCAQHGMAVKLPVRARFVENIIV